MVFRFAGEPQTEDVVDNIYKEASTVSSSERSE